MPHDGCHSVRTTDGVAAGQDTSYADQSWAIRKIERTRLRSSELVHLSVRLTHAWIVTKLNDALRVF